MQAQSVMLETCNSRLVIGHDRSIKRMQRAAQFRPCPGDDDEDVGPVELFQSLLAHLLIDGEDVSVELVGASPALVAEICL